MTTPHGLSSIVATPIRRTGLSSLSQLRDALGRPAGWPHLAMRCG